MDTEGEMKQAAAELKDEGGPGTSSSAVGAPEEGKDDELVSGWGVDTVAAPVVAPVVAHSGILRCCPVLPGHTCHQGSVFYGLLEVNVDDEWDTCARQGWDRIH